VCRWRAVPRRWLSLLLFNLQQCSTIGVKFIETINADFDSPKCTVLWTAVRSECSVWSSQLSYTPVVGAEFEPNPAYRVAHRAHTQTLVVLLIECVIYCCDTIVSVLFLFYSWAVILSNVNYLLLKPTLHINALVVHRLHSQRCGVVMSKTLTHSVTDNWTFESTRSPAHPSTVREMIAIGRNPLGELVGN